ncbi:N-carbamoylputrescine amidase [Halioxenophilus aromaticivorans]|uniref:N-carbamoylputrescine amidase n=1 Tax=Halioxenophilus aromaticivorans TaxID=1306992 RepID=A0AAV3U0W0_9ALTE
MNPTSSQAVTVAATQMACTACKATNLRNAEALVEQAARQGAQIILLQELFAGPYFCKTQNPSYFDWAEPLASSDTIAYFAELAKRLQVVLPISYFERANNAFFNSLVVIDADGQVLENYRKSHIPNGPGYQEKHYFSPGDTGFKVWQTQYARIGVAICWDQWFPEAARALALAGAEVLFYPTAIGSEPQSPHYDSQPHWQRVMQGHAAANMLPVVVSNRVGVETDDDVSLTFYGSSFITSEDGAILAQLNRQQEGIICQRLDLPAMAEKRRAWGLFRDRRPDLYKPLLSY